VVDSLIKIGGVIMTATVKGPHGVKYEQVGGSKIYISKQNLEKKIQGTNIGLLQDGKIRVLGYIIRKGEQWTHNHKKYFSLKEIIIHILNAYGFTNETKELFIVELSKVPCGND
jgi:hypothetical protein